MTLLSFNDIVKRASTCSDLVNNTTLKELELNIIQPDASKVDDEGMAELAKVLRCNRGLETIDICMQMMTNIGRRSLLDSLRDNLTLRILKTTRRPFLIDPQEREDLKVRKERMVLQSKIDKHMEWNKLYQRCMNTKRRIPVTAYPKLLSKLGNKPLALFLFLKQNNPKLVEARNDLQQSSRQGRKRKYTDITTMAS